MAALIARKIPVDSIDKIGWTPLFLAIKADRKGRTMTWFPPQRNRRDMLLALLRGGVSTAWRNEQGFTPLNWAILNGRIEFMQLLLESGAPLTLRDGFDRSPLMRLPLPV